MSFELWENIIRLMENKEPHQRYTNEFNNRFAALKRLFIRAVAFDG